jgi:hypothetical protein
MKLWNNDDELQFFNRALKSFLPPEKLFYKLKDTYYAYIPKKSEADGQTLQSRNALIGQFTEKWCKDLFEPIATKLELYAVNGVVCDELALTKQSSADLAFCTTNDVTQEPENIKLLFEIKMSIVSNYKYTEQQGIELIGDYKSHKGTPSIQRSDSMLKAIGKAMNIRVSDPKSTRIPIIILGNSPITDSYRHKVDALKTSGVIQGFWSLNPNPCTTSYVKDTDKKGFITLQTIHELSVLCEELVNSDLNYFSSMMSKELLGKVISIANQEKDDIAKAEKFLKLIKG